MIRKYQTADRQSIDNLIAKYLHKKPNITQETIWVYLVDDQVVGFVSYHQIMGVIEIMDLVVDELHQHQGIGQKLIKHLIDHEICFVLQVEVNEINANAIKFYESAGFKLVNIRKNYYGPQNGLVYQKDLKPITILAIETSCDETSVAILKNNEVLTNQVLSQIDIHAAFGGVVPELASRNHIAHIARLIETALKAAKINQNEIDYVAVTYGPGLIGSLLVGINAAQAFALAIDKPLIGINHLKGHIYAATLTHQLDYPALSLLISGGHTELIDLPDQFSFVVIGSTLDDAVGEAYDKVARVLGMPYPGGKFVDQKAEIIRKQIEDQSIDEKTIAAINRYPLPVPLSQDNSYNFSFSGLKSAVLNYLNKAASKGEAVDVEALCFNFQQACIKALTNKLIKAIEQYQPRTIIIAGGVAANRGLRHHLASISLNYPNSKFVFPEFEYCGDQAAMIGIAALYEIKQMKAATSLVLKADSSLNL